MTRKFDEDDEFDESDEMPLRNLNNVLRETSSDNIRWLLEEFTELFDNTSNDKIKLMIAKQFLQYFQKCLSEPNSNLREYARVGLQKIKELFPELVKSTTPSSNLK